MLQEFPESAEFDVVYSSDDEGNEFCRVSYSPSLGYFDGGYRGEFYSADSISEDELEEELNAVCIN